jgi:acyl transferase domain-containing protein
MMACRIPAAELTELLNGGSEDFRGMSISCMNGPQDFVLAGPLASLTKFAEYCKGKSFKCKQLPVPFGFHSAAMDPMLQDLAQLAVETTAKTPTIQLGSSLHGRVLEPGSTIEPNYFVNHAREPVNFTGLIEDVANWAAGSDMTVIEIGPSPSSKSRFVHFLVIS